MYRIILLAAMLCCCASVAIGDVLNPTGRDIELQVPLVMGTVQAGMVTLFLSKDDEVSVPGEGLQALLETRLNADGLAIIRAAVDADDRVLISDIQSEDFMVRYDPGSLSLVFDVDSAYLESQKLSAKSEVSSRTSTNDQAWFSSYANVRAATVSTDSDDGSTQLIIGDVDGVSRFGPLAIVYEASGTRSDADSSFKRSRVAAVHESRKDRRTITLGEINTNGESFQESSKILGIAIDRDYRLTPGYIASPSARTGFTLEDNASVDVLVNDRLRTTLRLGPGRYDLSDIPLTFGENQIKLLIRSDTGEERILDFSVFQTRELLEVGELDYYLGLGFSGESEDSGEHYASDRPFLTGFLRRGVNSASTASLNLQATDGLIGLGGTLTRATPVGSLNLDYRLLRSSEGSGSTASISFGNYGGSLTGLGSKGIYSISLEASTRHQPTFDSVWHAQDDVRVLPEGVGAPASRQVLALNYDRSFKRLDFAFGINAINSRVRALRSLVASVDVGGSLGSGLRWSVGLSSEHRHEDSGLDPSTQSIVARLSWRPSRQTRLSLDARSRDSSLRLTASAQHNTNRTGGYGVSASASHAEEDDAAFDLRGNYYSNYLIAGIDHRTNLESEDSGQISISSVRVETALAFANGMVAVGRPISNSFGILSAHPSLQGKRIVVDPLEDSNLVETGFLGRVIVPDLGMHSSSTIRYEVEDLPLGYDLGTGVFQVDPWLGTGYDLTVGSDATATVIGVLKDQQTGEPFSLIVGVVEPVNKSGGLPMEFFTNRTGKFALSGIAPGEYKLVLGAEKREATLSIRPDQGTLIRLGDIVVP